MSNKQIAYKIVLRNFHCHRPYSISSLLCVCVFHTDQIYPSDPYLMLVLMLFFPGFLLSFLYYYVLAHSRLYYWLGPFGGGVLFRSFGLYEIPFIDRGDSYKLNMPCTSRKHVISPGLFGPLVPVPQPGLANRD